MEDGGCCALNDISCADRICSTLTHTHTVSHSRTPSWARERSPRRADGMLSELIPRVLAEKRMSLKFIGRNYKSNNNSNNWENNSSSSSAAAALTLSDRLPDSQTFPV